MPYIKQELRKFLNIDDDRAIESTGELNYFITNVIMNFLPANYSYNDLNAVMGVLESVKQEFYRRVVVPYEEQKKKENGDVYFENW